MATDTEIFDHYVDYIASGQFKGGTIEVSPDEFKAINRNIQAIQRIVPPSYPADGYQSLMLMGVRVICDPEDVIGNKQVIGSYWEQLSKAERNMLFDAVKNHWRKPLDFHIGKLPFVPILTAYKALSMGHDPTKLLVRLKQWGEIKPKHEVK